MLQEVLGKANRLDILENKEILAKLHADAAQCLPETTSKFLALLLKNYAKIDKVFRSCLTRLISYFLSKYFTKGCSIPYAYLSSRLT